MSSGELQNGAVGGAPAGLEELLFFGSTEHKLDSKNRVHVPKRFREPSAATGRDSEGVAFQQFFLMPWEADGCVWLLTRQQFQHHAASVPRTSFAGVGSTENRQLQRSFFSSVEVLEVDAQGRITLPAHLLETLFGEELAEGGERKVQMVGSGDRAEIWSVKRWQSQPKVVVR